MIRTVILSPHCDDAPFSLGAALLAREFGVRPRVHVVFSRCGFARGPHRGEPADTVTAVRKAEETCAARLAGYAPVFWDLPEAFVRPGLGSFDTILDPTFDLRSDGVWSEVLERMRTHLSDEIDVICVPLGCGNHVDHRLVRDAALVCCAEAGLCERLAFYEDLPYAAGLPSARLDEYVHTVGREIDSEIDVEVEVEPVVLGADYVRAKQALLGCYASQVTARSIAAVAMHANRIGGERLWAHPACARLLRSPMRLDARSVVSNLP